mmetsp:Transcript_18024/g.45087  ORF Transcript_18024/g.45087 Transcript_18024/m.45087 type:complete len:216 (+) Transcript_18024:673-1320(+)
MKLVMPAALTTEEKRFLLAHVRHCRPRAEHFFAALRGLHARIAVLLGAVDDFLLRQFQAFLHRRVAVLAGWPVPEKLHNFIHYGIRPFLPFVDELHVLKVLQKVISDVSAIPRFQRFQQRLQKPARDPVTATAILHARHELGVLGNHLLEQVVSRLPGVLVGEQLKPVVGVLLEELLDVLGLRRAVDALPLRPMQKRVWIVIVQHPAYRAIDTQT